MIIANGYIEVKKKTAGGLDPETGYPVASSFEWGDKIPCQYLQDKHDRLAHALGEPITEQTYQILLEERPLVLKTSEQIRLSDLLGNKIGEFSVRQVEYLQAVSEIRIRV